MDLDLKAGLNGLAKKQDEIRESIEDNNELLEEITFSQVKRKIINLIKTDIHLKQMYLNTFDNENTIIIYQGLKSNVLARIKENGQHIILRAVLEKKFREILNVKITRQ